MAAVKAAAGLTVKSGGILLTPTQSTFAATIDEGTVTSGNGTDLIIITNPGNALTINSKLTGAVGLTKSGGGTLIVANSGNDFAGPVTVNGGVVQVQASGALGGNAIAIYGNGGVTSQLVLAAGVTLDNTIAISGASAASGQGTITALGAATLNGRINFVTDPQQAGGSTFAGPLTLNGFIAAPAGLTLSGQGALVFGGGGNYTSFLVNSGATALAAPNGLSTFAVLKLGGTGSASLDLRGFNQTLAGLTITNVSSASIANTGAAAAVFTLQVPAGRAEISPVVLTGNLALVKSGEGMQTLTNLHSYTGPTTVSAGTLAIDGAISGAIAVQAGATLLGSGVVGALTVSNGGTVAPGDGPGQLHTGDLQLGAGSHLSLELETVTESDSPLVNGAVSLAGDLQITLLPNFAERIGDKFLVLLNETGAPVSGTFSNAPNGIVRDDTGHLFAVNYGDHGDGALVANDVSLTLIALPEPGAAALLLGGVMLLARRRRG